MDEQLAAFLTYLQKEHQYSENTIAAYRNDLSQFASYLRERSGGRIAGWSDVTEADIESYVEYMRRKPKPYASSTIARKVAAIKSLFNHLESHDKVDDNPSVEVSSPKVKKRPPQTLTTAEVERLVASANDGDSPKNLRDRALLNVLYETGMRVSEVVALQLGDLDLAKRHIVAPTRQGEDRQIPFNKRTASLLQDYLDQGRPKLVRSSFERALFVNHRGEKLTRQGLWLIIKGYAKEAGLETEVTPHTLRHSFAVHRLEQGTDLEDIRHMLGHANISTTQVYRQLEQTNTEQASQS